ncbi:RadC family protein [Desulfoferrobacter suflitae]|uniref:RadC family protein n=1 Tax=Desulfoferrobacter suflitae TaxID=2865782 RepID=UPI00216475A9|nr:DNA repair protein RadC [Desulfoferrobacter suflitae]MCK8600128.1 DNA repair protein RadC [Desulfoferrobacter suflitae]
MYDPKRQPNPTRQSPEFQKNDFQAARKRLQSTSSEIGPRQKLWKKGAAALTDTELLAILVAGNKKPCNVIALADRILKNLEYCNWQPKMRELLQVKGVGVSKASLIAAVVELARRRIHPREFKISWPTDVLPLIHYIAERKQEHFICISLNGANEVLAVRIVAVGLLDRVQVHPRELFADPIAERASAVILAHNHPTGIVTPSEDDRAVTKQLVTVGKLLGIPVYDHIIFTRKSHYSFLENLEI